MSGILEKQIVLSLNASWQALGWRTVEQAVTSLTGGSNTPPALALDIELDEEGNVISAIPKTWDEWIKLPVRPTDLSIGIKNGEIRAPTIIVSRSFAAMPLKTPKLSNRAILERDGYRCAYTGEKLPKSQLSVDHVIPSSRGGKNDWMNMVSCQKNLNSDKGNRLNSEIGLKLKIVPRIPKPLPACATMGEGRRKEHVPFLKK